jgi:dimethylhistidine N-methyltransferase
VFADFTRPFELPVHPVEPQTNLIFFPGSTIGNFTRKQALELLEVMAAVAKPGGAALIGVDLRKDPMILRAAYNDSEGVTAAFNLNVLERLNRELGANFDVERFQHLAVYDDEKRRIEMRLISTCKQTATIADMEVRFSPGEYIITEYSHKYSIEEFHALAHRAGFAPERSWVDDDDLFSVHYLRATEPTQPVRARG